jgi:3-oxoacyl-[acyl-carrier protein] reductase
MSEALTLDAGCRIDILVNNAAAELNKSLENISADDFASVCDLNIRSPTLLTKVVLPHLRCAGRIVNTSSVGARAGFANLSLYCSSKTALKGLTRCWAAEVGKDGTTVNAIASGPG